MSTLPTSTLEFIKIIREYGYAGFRQSLSNIHLSIAEAEQLNDSQLVTQLKDQILYLQSKFPDLEQIRLENDLKLKPARLEIREARKKRYDEELQALNTRRRTKE